MKKAKNVCQKTAKNPKFNGRLRQKKLIFPGFVNSEFSFMDIKHDISYRVIFLTSLLLARLNLAVTFLNVGGKVKAIGTCGCWPSLQPGFGRHSCWCGGLTGSLGLTGKLCSLPDCCEPAAVNLWPNHRESGISELQPRVSRTSRSDLKQVTSHLRVPHFQQ